MHGMITARLAPSADDRRAIAGRSQKLANSIAPGHPQDIRVALTALKAAFPAQQVDENTAKMEARLLMEAVSRFPAWAVSKVCEKFITGQVPRKTNFAPTIAEIVPLCEAETVEVRLEIARIERILKAEVVSEPTEDSAARAAIVERELRKFGKGWGIREEIPKEPEITPAEACMSTLGISQAEFDAIPGRKTVGVR